jgi:two-component SAPR family response regulator
VLVVEDEVLIGMLLEDMLAELGYQIVATVSRVDEALKAAQSVECDVAILDVNLSGQEVYPVAEVLAARSIPFIFATGYGERGLPSLFRACPTLQKPFQLETLERELKKLDGQAK